MKALLLGLVLVVAVLALSPQVCSGEDGQSEIAMGEKLVRGLWTDIKNADIEALESKTADGFQSIHQFGANNMEQELALIKGLAINSYSLSAFKVTRNGPLVVATYSVSVEETIEGERLSKKPAPRMTVFLKTEHGWQWIAHANLKPIEETDK